MAAANAVEILATVPPQRRTAVLERRTDELAAALAPHRDLAPVRNFNEFRATWAT
jgi:hypothetical protein